MVGWRKPDKWRHSPQILSTSTIRWLPDKRQDKHDGESLQLELAQRHRFVSDSLEKIQEAIPFKRDRRFNWLKGRKGG